MKQAGRSCCNANAGRRCNDPLQKRSGKPDGDSRKTFCCNDLSIFRKLWHAS